MTGVAAPFLLGAPARGMAHRAPEPSPWRLRPPGVAPRGDARFLAACVRCSACYKACPTHALQPTGITDGVGGLFAPKLTPRMGACAYDCRACAEVCPTGAIPLLSLKEKQKTPMGLAIHDHTRCLPWAVGGECRVCQEHCPAPGKAIKLKMGRSADGGAVMMPYVDADLCIGCGTCEFVCPVEGAAGVRVVAREATDRMRHVLQPPKPGVGWSA